MNLVDSYIKAYVHFTAAALARRKYLHVDLEMMNSNHVVDV